MPNSDNLPEYPAVYSADIEVIKNADPKVLSAVHSLLMSGHAAGLCQAGKQNLCYFGSFRKFSELIRSLEIERSNA